MAGTHIDRDALHRYLYRRVDRFGRLRVNLKQLAEELGVNYCHLSTVLGQFATEGRLRIVGGHTYQPKTYVVSDPGAWRGVA